MKNGIDSNRELVSLESVFTVSELFFVSISKNYHNNSDIVTNRKILVGKLNEILGSLEISFDSFYNVISHIEKGMKSTLSNIGQLPRASGELEKIFKDQYIILIKGLALIFSHWDRKSEKLTNTLIGNVSSDAKSSVGDLYSIKFGFRFLFLFKKVCFTCNKGLQPLVGINQFLGKPIFIWYKYCKILREIDRTSQEFLSLMPGKNDLEHLF